MSNKRIKKDSNNSINSNKPIHGNYKGYYNKRGGAKEEGDSRFELIPKEWLKNKLILDVGCNIGLTTIELALKFQPKNVQGCDIDANLIKSASKQVELNWSRQQPLNKILEAAAINLVKKDKTIRELPPHQEPSQPAASTSFSSTLPTPPPTASYFPVGLPRLFGFLPLPPKELLTTYEETTSQDNVENSSAFSARKGKRKAVESVVAGESKCFPLNIGFTVADWPNERIGSDRYGYDVIFALSITKWIHLNHLNEGLLIFFTKAFESLLPGGKFILEPQPFSTYSKSARFSDQLKINFEKLKIQGEDRGWRDEEGDFERVLLGIGFERKENLRVRGEGGFERPLDVYYKGLYGAVV